MMDLIQRFFAYPFKSAEKQENLFKVHIPVPCFFKFLFFYSCKLC